LLNHLSKEREEKKILASFVGSEQAELKVLIGLSTVKAICVACNEIELE